MVFEKGDMAGSSGLAEAIPHGKFIAQLGAHRERGAPRARYVDRVSANYVTTPTGRPGGASCAGWTIGVSPGLGCDPRRRGFAPERGWRRGDAQTPLASLRVTLMVVAAVPTRDAPPRDRVGLSYGGLSYRARLAKQTKNR